VPQKGKQADDKINRETRQNEISFVNNSSMDTEAARKKKKSKQGTA